VPDKAVAPKTQPAPSDAEPEASLTAWLMFSVAGLFIFYQLNLQALPSVLRDGLVVDFSLTDAGFGGLSSSFYYPYMLLQIPRGLVLGRYGPRRLLLGGLFLCILATFITAYSRGMIEVTSARILMGVGAAPAFVATMALVARWFPARLFPIVVAITEMIGMLGAALGQEILGFVVQSAGWRTGMLLCGWFGILLLAAIGAVVKDVPIDAATEACTAAPRKSRAALGRMILSPSLVLAGLAGGMIYSAGLSFAMLWAVAFFQDHLGIDLATASFCASFFSWGIIVGFPVFGWACGRVAGPLPLLAGGAVATGASVAVILYAPPSLLLASTAMFFCGFACASYALTFVVVKAEVSTADAGPVFAFANMLIIAVGGLALQPLIGVLADAWGRPVTDPGSLGILVWAQAAALLLLAPLIWRARTRQLLSRGRLLIATRPRSDQPSE